MAALASPSRDLSRAALEALATEAYLGEGEAEAIILALEQPGALLLMDDRQGVFEARKRGVTAVGTLAVSDTRT